MNLIKFIQEIIYLKKGWGICKNTDQFKSIDTHWIALHVNRNNITYFYSFGVEHIPKEL